MIPKASQRGNGQDLATHLLNAHDNEYLEVADIRGAIAHDLHGAFAEWELQAQALTRCSNYLYSLSINPDHHQIEMTRERYLDYVRRAEEALGLGGQPRAVVFHIKDGREHCHVIWSRIDAMSGRAIHQAFDHEKLMMVTRAFARDYGITLPDRMTERERVDYRDKVTLYDRHQEAATGLTKEQRMAQITEAFRSADSANAFVRALEDLGYVLATGNRPYVLVDVYGGMNALPRMINDKSIRTKDVVAFLEKVFPPNSLPTVDVAKALIASHRKAQLAFDKAQLQQGQFDALKVLQADRRAGLERTRTETVGRQRAERFQLEERQREARATLRHAHVQVSKDIRIQRYAHRATGLAAFLGRVTGVSAVIRKVHKAQDAARLRAYREEKKGLEATQAAARMHLGQRHSYQLIEIDRQVRGLDQVDKRERESLELMLTKKARTKRRGDSWRMPTLSLDLVPPGRRDAPHRAMGRHQKSAQRKLAQAFEEGKHRVSVVNLERDFERAARGDEGRGEGERDEGKGRGRRRGPRMPRGASRGKKDGPGRGR